METLAPNRVIGIIGGGQLGRMTAQAAARLGYQVHIFTPEEDSPASKVAAKTTVAAYDNEELLRAFANDVDVVTFEFENIPHSSLALLESLVPVRPSSRILKISQNRLVEKDTINDMGIRTAAYGRVTNVEELRMGIESLGLPTVLKTSEMGYDGKGQISIKPEDVEQLESDELDKYLNGIWQRLATHEAVLESFVQFDLEISVIVARNESEEIAVYPPVQNIHKNHILHKTIVPAPIGDDIAKEAIRIAGTIADELELIGLLAVEMFVCSDGTILVNEIAPRPHNSGHWSMDAALTGQFEQLIRAICGLPLGSTTALCKAEMLNLIGDDVNDYKKYLELPNARLHLYGKKEVRKGRKMGHVNFLNLNE